MANNKSAEDAKRFIKALENQTLYIIDFGTTKSYNNRIYSCSSKGMQDFQVMMSSLGIYTRSKDYSTLSYPSVIHKVLNNLLNRNLLTKEVYYKLNSVNVTVLNR